MCNVKSAVTDEAATFSSVSELFDRVGINQQKFQSAFECIGKKSQLVLKPRPTDVWMNPFNKGLLKAWDANMDIHYIVDAYVCIVYITSYISKAE